MEGLSRINWRPLTERVVVAPTYRYYVGYPHPAYYYYGGFYRRGIGGYRYARPGYGPGSVNPSAGTHLGNTFDGLTNYHREYGRGRGSK